MITFVAWRWQPKPGYRSEFPPETVIVLRNMLARHYAGPQRFVCVTDRSAELPADIETIPLWTEYANVPSPYGPKYPSCYRRLRMFAPDAAQLFGGERLVSVDLDSVITGPVAPLFDRPEDVVLYGETHPTTYYNGGLFMLRAGTRTKVWTDFDPQTSPQQSRAAGQHGSDQGWLSFCLGPREAKWTKRDGVYSYRNEIQKRPGQTLPADARIVSFHGLHKPWAMQMREYPWVAEHWC